LGVFSDVSINSLGADGLFNGGGASLLGKQALASIVVFAFSFVVTYLVALVINKTIGLRVSTEQELVGLDQSQHAETAYQA
jgi:Amt family ammonium transporter